MVQISSCGGSPLAAGAGPARAQQETTLKLKLWGVRPGHGQVEDDDSTCRDPGAPGERIPAAERRFPVPAPGAAPCRAVAQGWEQICQAPGCSGRKAGVLFPFAVIFLSNSL